MGSARFFDLNRRIVLIAGLGAVASRAFADTYPSRPIRFFVGYAAGGAPDIFARVLATQLGKALGQSIIVENRAGAGGTIAAGQVASATPDGYTLLIAESAQIELAPLIYKKVPYDPVKDLTHIGRLSVSPGLGIVVDARNPELRTMEGLIQYAKANPGKLNYGSSGIGSTHHIAMEGIKAALGLDIVHVPFKGSSESLPALMGGNIQLTLGALPSIMGDVKAGKLRLLAITGKKRFKGVPDTPCMAEFIQAYEPIVSQFSMVGPAKMPADLVAKLSEALRDVLSQSEVVAKVNALNYEPAWSSPSDYKAEVQVNLKKYARALKIAGVEPS